MNELITFFANYGLAITIIAVIGIAILGVLKYSNLFKNIEEKNRHYIYLAISVGISLIASIVYLLIIKQFQWDNFIVIAGAIYALNQTFYNIFKTTSLNALGTMILDFIRKLLTKNNKDKPKKDDNNITYL